MNSLRRRIRFQSGARYDIYVGKNYEGFVKAHAHDFFQIMIVFRGQVTQQQSGLTVKQKPGDVFFTPRGVDHALTIHGPDTRYYCLSFSQNIAIDIVSAFSSEALQELLPDPVIHLSEEEMARTTEICELILQEQAREKEKGPDAGIYLTEALAVMLLRRKFKSDLLTGTHRRNHMEAVKQVIDYIEENYRHDIDVEELCRVSHLSKSALYNTFPKVMGITIQQYITETRIHEAIRLSYATDLNWAEIASQVGYNDFSTFYRNFVKVTGSSPSKYLESSDILFGPAKARSDDEAAQ